MTFKQCQDRTLSRLNLTTTAARTRVKNAVNERNRRLATSCSLSRVRRGTVSINTVADTATITSTGVVKVFGIMIPTSNRILTERSIGEMRQLDPAETTTGEPYIYGVQRDNAASQTIQLFPIPDDIYALDIDGLLTGTDMSADGDIPAFPEDFHDALIFGALADEYGHAGDTVESERYEQKYEQRLRDLRYYLRVSGFLAKRQNSKADTAWWAPATGFWIA
jgi:hypothetical protein